MPKFVDDEPVYLDCGHVAYLGDKYFEYSANINGTDVMFTSCSDDDCIDNCLRNIVEELFHIEEIKVLEAQDHEDNFADRNGDY